LSIFIGIIAAGAKKDHGQQHRAAAYAYSGCFHYTR
jgi:hypothetical protein